MASVFFCAPSMGALTGEQTQLRRDEIAKLLAQGDTLACKLDRRNVEIKPRGRKLSESGARVRFFHAVSEAHLSRIIKVDLLAETFCYEVDEHAQALAEMMDGKLLLVSNTPEFTLTRSSPATSR